MMVITETVARFALFGGIDRLGGQVDGADGLFELREGFCCGFFGLFSCAIRHDG